jgi:hypothetical protein
MCDVSVIGTGVMGSALVEVRSGSGVFLISDERNAYEAYRYWFERLSRTTTYVDSSSGSAYISEMAVLLIYLSMMGCLCCSSPFLLLSNKQIMED